MIWSPDIYARAWEFATLAHQNQFYGGRTEGIQINYINHIGSVAMEVINAIQLTTKNEKLDTNLAVQCALLHDTIEDTSYTYEDLKNEFSAKVADGVSALTKNESLPKDQRMLDSLRRIKQQPREVWMVKMADRICNLYHPPYYWVDDKILSYQREAVLILENLEKANHHLAIRLKQKIEAYNGFLN